MMSMILDGDAGYTVPMKSASSAPRLSVEVGLERVDKIDAQRVIEMQSCAANCGAYRGAQLFKLDAGTAVLRIVCAQGYVDLVIAVCDLGPLGRMLESTGTNLGG